MLERRFAVCADIFFLMARICRYHAVSCPLRLLNILGEESGPFCLSLCALLPALSLPIVFFSLLRYILFIVLRLSLLIPPP